MADNGSGGAGWKTKFPPLVIAAGLVVGALAGALVKLGNPGNMGLCIVCFERDIAGALGLHRAAAVQYLRPEIFAMVLGAAAAARLGKEFVPRSASAPAVRFVLGVFVSIGALVFMGCPRDMAMSVGTFSFTLAGRDNAEAAAELEGRYGVMTRVGLQCAPAAHKAIGTYPQGTIRASIGYFTTDEEVRHFLDSLRQMCRGR
jgi:selenocysteine lyase/cysteine desulfurase